MILFLCLHSSVIIFRVFSLSNKKSRSYKQGRDYVRLLGIAYKQFSYQAQGKIIPKTDQQDIIKV
jgi:hypothetical protein